VAPAIQQDQARTDDHGQRDRHRQRTGRAERFESRDGI